MWGSFVQHIKNVGYTLFFVSTWF